MEVFPIFTPSIMQATTIYDNCVWLLASTAINLDHDYCTFITYGVKHRQGFNCSPPSSLLLLYIFLHFIRQISQGESFHSYPPLKAVKICSRLRTVFTPNRLITTNSSLN